MATYREIVNIVLDELKLTSDDSHFVEEHVLFLANKYRAFILKQRYSDIRKEIPISNYQVICVDLEVVTLPASNICGAGTYLRSKQPIPNLLTIVNPELSSLDLFTGNYNYVSPLRFKYAGHNKFLRNQVYATIAPDNYLYMKSNNSQLYYLKKVKISGIFENSDSITELNCNKECNEDGIVTNEICDVLDMQYPLEEALIPVVTELIVKELSGFKYQAQDSINNANDDLSNLAAYIRQQVSEGRRSDLYKNP
jgi:hypothetical protein